MARSGRVPAPSYLVEAGFAGKPTSQLTQNADKTQEPPDPGLLGSYRLCINMSFRSYQGATVD